MSNAARQRRFRQRQKAGITVYPVAADDTFVGELIDGGILEAEDALDPQSVGKGILKAARQTLRLGRK